MNAFLFGFIHRMHTLIFFCPRRRPLRPRAVAFQAPLAGVEALPGTVPPHQAPRAAQPENVAGIALNVTGITLNVAEIGHKCRESVLWYT